jgi:hypothetical protein
LADKFHIISAPPQSQNDLPDSFFTRRKNDLLKNLPPESSGMTCFLAPRYESSKGGDPGPWGNMISAVVP